VHVVFATNEAVGLAFRSAIGTAGLFAFLAAVVLWAAGRQHRAFGWRFSLCASVVLFTGCVAVARHARDSRFFEINVAPDQLSLSFFNDPSPVVVRRDQVESVLFGYDGKYSHFCHVKIVMKSGDSYESALTPAEKDVCKAYRRQIMQLMAL
jgi:hypothetical protein